MICRISFKDFRKYTTAKNWWFHRIQNVRFDKKWPFDLWFSMFLIVFFDFENSKVGLNHEIPEPLQMNETQKFFLHNKIWLHMYQPKKIQIEPRSFWPVMTSSKILRFSINLLNSEDFNPYANNENDRIIIYLIIWLVENIKILSLTEFLCMYDP